ncbi:CASP8-associated protein 2 [Aplochiton taeniatus]
MYEGIGDANGGFTEVHNEDSVDIYSGLDNSPKSIADDKICTRLSPQVIESMDLYEEIITEEQESKESSHNELKTRFSAAINQIEELRKRLGQMETQNTALTTQNCRLKKNISALIRTARMEVVRKDEEINRLNKGSVRAYGHHIQPQMNGLRDTLSSTPNSSRISIRRPPPLAQSIRPREDHPSKEDVSSKEAKKSTPDMSKNPVIGPQVAGKSSLEENSPNRKLCFMETLNLTLSPVKKPTLPCDSKKQSGSPVQDVSEISTGNDSEQPDIDDLCVIDELNSTLEKDVYGISEDVDAVSSTISMEVLPEEVKLSEAISHFTQMDEDVHSITLEPSSSTGVSRVTSTTEEVASPEKHSRDLPFTPKRSCGPALGFSEKERCAEPTCSIPLHLDEDSMMLTLNSLKSIPDVISPLTSPMHPTKRTPPQSHSKPAHVKSLRKDFFNITVDAASVKLDVNKENKHPGCSMKRPAPSIADKTSKFPSIVPEDEIEEGEIVSESEEETVPSSPSHKTVKSARPVKNQSTPQSFSRTSKRLAEEKHNTSKTNADRTSDFGSPSSTESSSSNKSRSHKTVCPALPNTSFSTPEEVMEMFKTIRQEVRKKYMKLHKTFPKKSFYGIIDNLIESFLEFVDVANLSWLCSQSDDLKTKLKNMITSVLSKVSNNGIVNRIFDQQSFDFKQKLWNFVDGQLDFLFKEIKSALASVCKSKMANHGVDKEKIPSENNKTSKMLRSPIKNTTRPKAPQREEIQRVKNNKKIRCQTLVPCKTGLGSRGKDIRSILEGQKKDPLPYQPRSRVIQTPPKHKSSTPEKVTFVRQLSHSGSIQDNRSDFEILTEQQASSLTFNLVRDTQMGEIFKCLLQGSDLLDNGATAGDSHGWPVGTPRKEAHALERFGITNPNQVPSPSKLIATWSTISPNKMFSPQSTVQHPPNPAFLDESCLLEVPCGRPQSRMTPQRNLFPQAPYSILAEDLAVSLTIPSPLKSDSHLSFLHPARVEPMSAPDSVISAHFSEDALMDGEDATEQDIHLALDTDNSSCGSSDGRSMEPAAPPLFHFKPDLPMQAVVTERSNDHFIVRIRQASTSSAEPPLTGESFGKSTSGDELESSDAEMENFNSLTIAEEDGSTSEKDQKPSNRGKKRKAHQEKPKAKRVKNADMQKPRKEENGNTSKTSKNLKSPRKSKKERNKAVSCIQLSPNSLSAKNVIKKKGEVMVTWTREEDRAILVDLKVKGATPDTFSALSEKLHKSQAQIAERFAQLIKLFKKTEKMES